MLYTIISCTARVTVVGLVSFVCVCVCVQDIENKKNPHEHSGDSVRVNLLTTPRRKR